MVGLRIAGKAPPRVCRHLRAKAPFDTFEQVFEPWEAGVATNTSYWCLVTMDAAGPDDGVAHGLDCRPGRACCELDG